MHHYDPLAGSSPETTQRCPLLTTAPSAWPPGPDVDHQPLAANRRQVMAGQLWPMKHRLGALFGWGCAWGIGHCAVRSAWWTAERRSRHHQHVVAGADWLSQLTSPEKHIVVCLAALHPLQWAYCGMHARMQWGTALCCRTWRSDWDRGMQKHPSPSYTHHTFSSTIPPLYFPSIFLVASRITQQDEPPPPYLVATLS